MNYDFACQIVTGNVNACQIVIGNVSTSISDYFLANKGIHF